MAEYFDNIFLSNNINSLFLTKLVQVNIIQKMLGVKLKKLRETNGMVQRQIAALLEVDTAFISKVEKEEKQISKNHIARLAKLFKVPANELNSIWVADKILALIEDEKKDSIERILEIVSETKKIKAK